jgi:hypothetical protein
VLGEVEVERVRLDESGGSPAPGGAVDVEPGEIATLRLRAIESGR